MVKMYFSLVYLHCIISRVLNFPEIGGGGEGVEVSRALVAPPPANFSRTRTSDPPRRLKDLSQDINQSFFF